MAHIVKCKYCGKEFDTDKEEFVKPVSNRYAHKKCAEDQDKELLAREKAEDSFYQYLKVLYNDYNYIKIKRIVESYIKKYSYTYSGMEKALRWFYEIKKNPVNEKGIAMIPYIYKDAYDYYYSIYCMSLVNEDKDLENFKIETHEVEIQAPQVKKKKRKMFDMEDD